MTVARICGIFPTQLHRTKYEAVMTSYSMDMGAEAHGCMGHTQPLIGGRGSNTLKPKVFYPSNAQRRGKCIPFSVVYKLPKYSRTDRGMLQASVGILAKCLNGRNATTVADTQQLRLNPRISKVVVKLPLYL